MASRDVNGGSVELGLDELRRYCEALLCIVYSCKRAELINS